MRKARGESDEFHLHRATELEAVIVTRDADFLELASEENHEGIFKLTGFDTPEKVFDEMNQYFDEDLGKNFLIYI